jgi:hypothetical protein
MVGIKTSFPSMPIEIELSVDIEPLGFFNTGRLFKSIFPGAAGCPKLPEMP